MNLNILILEDNIERQNTFKKHLNKATINLVIVDNVGECIAQLKSNKWQLLMLDHDLGGQIMVPSGENTGYEVAKFLEENKQFMPVNVIVHSLNVVGAENILAALSNAVHIPFVWIEENLKKIGVM